LAKRAELLSMLPVAGDAEPSTVIWALGRLRDPSTSEALVDVAHHADRAPVRTAAAIAALRAGAGRQDVTRCLAQHRGEDWTLLPLAISGDASVVPTVLEAVTGSRHSTDAVLAAGLLGTVDFVEPLIACLADEGMAGTAALALDVLTGAALYEEVLVPDLTADDELFDDELEPDAGGAPSTPAAGRPAGTVVRRRSQQAERWREWWSTHRSAFQPRTRYRDGRPYSPASLLAVLESARSPRALRQLVYDECVVQYGLDVPFETEMPVVEQERALVRYRELVAAAAGQVRPGAWYRAGRLTSG
jgi:hypothetical protein